MTSTTLDPAHSTARPQTQDVDAAGEPLSPFVARHIGPDAEQRRVMLAALRYPSIADLVDAAVPASTRGSALELPPALDETQMTAELAAIAARNVVATSMIGLGYYDTVTPPVIRRGVLENPAWYTAYTSYQPEISQGRLEALLNFQTMVTDLTGLDIAGASLLDEPSAAAEGVALARRVSKAAPAARLIVDTDVLPQTVAVVTNRADRLGIPVEVTNTAAGLPDGEIVAVLVQYPGASGAVVDHAALIAAAHERGATAIVAADLLALTLLRPPGEIGADVVVGSAQRFGVPMAAGGPHAGYMAVRQPLARQLPGRLVGVSKDSAGAPAYRLALQTREQHIRRERATSNICTAQVLLAVMASMYAVYHGPEGLRAIAARVHGHATDLAARLRVAGVELASDAFFDTVTALVPGAARDVVDAAANRGINLRLVDTDTVSASCDEVTTTEHVAAVAAAFGLSGDARGELPELPASLLRSSDYLTHPVFSAHRSETQLLRYLRRLADKDYALDRGMIPLGSCTMKLNATAEMEPISWPGFARIHPYAPTEQTAGYQQLVDELADLLARITGYAAVSVQPNAGSQGEFAGLGAIAAFHRANGQPERDVCLIPSSAHGTNAASAVMAGMRVVVVGCDAAGNVDVADLRAKLAQHRGRVAAIMLTYPSTHGVYEQQVGALCRLVHDAGGQVYVDGANLNALVGLAKPGEFGADVSHLNLHKTFCIPHGGGGPGVGPIGVREHLARYLPAHPLRTGTESRKRPGPVSGAPWGSAGILPIPWAYIRMMGSAGLRAATEMAILSANYIAERLRRHYPVLYTGNAGLVAHECIIDLRPLTATTGVTVDDVAKRLVDYGFHAPTMSFPVPGTLMIEPTESEDLAEIDRFIDAMIAIRGEIDKVGSGRYPRDDNPLVGAPHTAAALTGDWDHPYSRAEAVFPLPSVAAGKYWPPVGRIDGAYGDRNLICSCPPMQAYQS